MKHTPRERAEAITVSIVGTFIVILIMAMTYTADREREERKIRDWQRFENCINPHPSDAVCDSCWTAIFGADATPEQVTPKHLYHENAN